MISDVLTTALLKIREWRDDCPHSYGNLDEEIDAVTNRMEELRAYLYMPDPSPEDRAALREELGLRS